MGKTLLLGKYNTATSAFSMLAFSNADRLLCFVPNVQSGQEAVHVPGQSGQERREKMRAISNWGFFLGGDEVGWRRETDVQKQKNRGNFN